MKAAPTNAETALLHGRPQTWWRFAAAELLDLVLPLQCRLCGVALDFGFACAEHQLQQQPSGTRCSRCASALPRGVPDRTPCAACRRRSPGVSSTLALGDYRGSLRDWVLAFKHRGRRDLAEPLGAALSELVAAGDGGEQASRALLVPIPLHPLRRLERGYDQAALLARAITRAGGPPTEPILRRRRGGPPQGSIWAHSRQRNVQRAFEVRWRVGGRMRGLGRRGALLAERDIWLVDDVATSMSTARQAARCLRQAGARRVRLLVIARALPREARALLATEPAFESELPVPLKFSP